MYLLQCWFNMSDEGVEDAVYDSYRLNLTMCQSFLKQIISNEKVSAFLEKYHPEIFEIFSKIAEIKVLNTENIDL